MSDVKVTSDLPTRITSVDIYYRYNQVPTATIGIDPTAGDFLSDLEGQRRKSYFVEVEVQGRGKVRFEGLFDGFPFTQAVGGFGYQINMVGNQQKILETYPEIVGVHPSSLSYFERFSSSFLAREGDKSRVIRAFGVDPTGLSLAEFFVKSVAAYLSQAFRVPRVSKAKLDEGLNALISSSVYKKREEEAQKLLENFDFTGVSNTALFASDSAITTTILNIIYQTNTNVWETILNGLGSMGLCLIPGNEKTFVVPENTFLKPDNSIGGLQAKSSTPNALYPADYTSLTFNDSGYVDIGHCYLIPDTAGLVQEDIIGFRTLRSGSFSDPKSKGASILLTDGGMFGAMSGVQFSALRQKLEREARASTAPAVQGELSKEDYEKAVQAADDSAREAYEDALQRFLNKLAEIKYYQSKYSDRTGSVLAEFSPLWCPGTPGTVYTRFPGIFVDFFVQEVHHHIAKNPDASGEAYTTISFSSGRVGKERIGSDSDGLYNYTNAVASSVQKSFIKDIGASQ